MKIGEFRAPLASERVASLLTELGFDMHRGITCT